MKRFFNGLLGQSILNPFVWLAIMLLMLMAATLALLFGIHYLWRRFT